MKKLGKEHGLVKLLLGFLLFVIVLTWIIPTGSYTTGAEFVDGSLNRIGLIHIVYAFVYAIQNYSIQIVFILCIGIFYSVLTKVDGYKKLVSKLASLGKGKEIIYAVVVSFIVAALTSVLNNSFILLVIIPFLIHILRSKGIDKLGTFIATFGAIIVGTLGATYGTEGVIGLITYLGYGGSEVTITTAIWARLGAFALAFVLYTFFYVLYLKKSLKKKENEESENELFVLEPVKNKKAKVWPVAVVMALLVILAFLGFFTWSNVNVDIFDKFHEWFMGLSIGEFKIFQELFGGSLTNMSYELTTSFGNWYLFSYSVILLIVALVLSFMSRIKWNEFLTQAGNGIKAMIKPIGLLVLAYMVFVFIYWSPIMPTVIHFIGGSGGFNPFIATLQSFVGNFFNSDLGYLSFSLSYYLGSFTGNDANVMFLIYTTMYGLVSFITPISIFLLFGLSYLDIPYKKWLKYIWKFVVAMLLVLVILFTVLTYV